MTTATDIKFGKIDRSEPISAGGTGEMDILARTGGGEWQVVGSVEVDATCTHEDLMSSHDRYAVDTFTAYLHDLDHADITVECFGYAASGRHAGQAVTRWGGRSPVRIYTAAEARRILKAKIAEALSVPEEPSASSEDDEAFPLCEDCVDNIGGAGAGPDAIWRPAAGGEACGAAYCVQDIVIEYNLTEGA